MIIKILKLETQLGMAKTTEREFMRKEGATELLDEGDPVLSEGSMLPLGGVSIREKVML